jgi:hypothetical protein
MTSLICAPTGDFLIELMCCSLSVSFENLIGCAGLAGADGALIGWALCFGFVVKAWLAAMLAKDDWHLSCCCLNLERLSLRSI